MSVKLTDLIRRMLDTLMAALRGKPPACRTCRTPFTDADAAYRTRSGQCCFCAQWERTNP